MDEKRQPEPAKETKPPKEKAENAKPGEGKQIPPKKSGPSIDIGPGPGSDVVATPPKRI